MNSRLRKTRRSNLQFEALEDRRMMAAAQPTKALGDDAYEQNDTMATASALGVVNNSITLNKLIMADGADWYSFDLATARTGVSINLNFTHAKGDLDLQVFDASGRGRGIGSSLGTTNTESVSTKSLVAGKYFIQVFGKNGAFNPSYSLNINPGVAVVPVLDLHGASIQASNAGSWGGLINVESQIRNTGNTASPAFNVEWYLSKDAVGSSDDVLLTSYTHPGIAVGGLGAKQTINMSLPKVAPTGFTGESFYILMKTDSAGQVAETNENNNFGQLGDGIDREKIVISPASKNFSGFDAWDASTDDSINTVYADGVLRVSYNFSGATLNKPGITLQAIDQNGTVVTLANFAGSAVGVQKLVNLAVGPALASGAYQLRLKATTSIGTLYSSVDTIKVLATTTVVDDYHGRAHSYTGAADTGWVFRGGGGTDTLNLGILPTQIVSLNGLNPNFSISTTSQAIYKGSAYDYLRLSNGAEIYFQGIERLRFSDGSIKELSVRPNDPAFGSQWNLHATDVPSAWRFTQGSSNVMLVSLDSGVLNGPTTPAYENVHDLNFARVIAAADATEDSFAIANYPLGAGHGHMAVSIMASTANNGDGTAGINWNSQVFVADVYREDSGANGLSLQRAITDALAYARANGKKVIFQGGVQGEYWLTDGGTTTSLQTIIRNSSDIALFAVAAGNGGPQKDGTHQLNDPNWQTSVSGVAKLESYHSNVMSVGALEKTFSVDVNGMTNAGTINLASYSNRGSNLTLVAPTDSPAMDKQHKVFEFWGTSAANPNLAGIASLVWSVAPSLSSTNVRQILVDTANDLGPAGDDNIFGNGLINADAAVRRAVAMDRAFELANLYPNKPISLIAGSPAVVASSMAKSAPMPGVDVTSGASLASLGKTSSSGRTGLDISRTPQTVMHDFVLRNDFAHLPKTTPAAPSVTKAANADHYAATAHQADFDLAFAELGGKKLVDHFACI